MVANVVIAGNIILDVIKQIDVYPEKGMLANITGATRAVGGCVCNTAIDLKRLDANLNVIVYGRVGADEYGEYIRTVMQQEGVDVRGVIAEENASTSYTDVMALKSTGERTFFQNRGANAHFCPADVPVDRLECAVFHLGYLLLLDGMDETDAQYGTRAARLLHEVQARGIRTSIDLVSEQGCRFEKVVAPSLRYCNYVVINEVEGGRLAGYAPRKQNGSPDLINLEKICRKIKTFGVRDAVVIHCPELSCGVGGDGVFRLLPSFLLPQDYIAGAVGAGDAFCAGMLYSFLKDMPLTEGMRLASCMAAENLSAPDAVSGAKNLQETMKIENKFKRRIINADER